MGLNEPRDGLRKYRALLFDLDGTLAETDSLHLQTWTDALDPHGIRVDEAFFRERISGRSNREIVRDLLPGLPEKERYSVVDTKELGFRERASGLKPLPGLTDFLNDVKALGLPTGLVTNAPGANAAAILGILGLGNFFDAVVLSEDVEAGKPDPAPYRAALREMDLPPEETLAFEDSVSGIASSTGAGIPTVGIASTQEPRMLLRAGAFVTATDFTDPELWRLIRGTRTLS